MPSFYSHMIAVSADKVSFERKKGKGDQRARESKSVSEREWDSRRKHALSQETASLDKRDFNSRT